MTNTTLTPPKQALLVFGVGFLLMLGGVALDKMGIMAMERLYPWSIATAFMLLFALLNSLSSISSKNYVKYWGVSVYSYLGLGIANGLSAWLLSGVSLQDAQSYRAVYIVVTFGFLVFLSIVNFMKNIVQFAEKEEWNQPRRRK